MGWEARDKNMDEVGETHGSSLGNYKCQCRGTAANVLRTQDLGPRWEMHTLLSTFLEIKPVFIGRVLGGF